MIKRLHTGYSAVGQPGRLSLGREICPTFKFAQQPAIQAVQPAGSFLLRKAQEKRRSLYACIIEAGQAFSDRRQDHAQQSLTTHAGVGQWNWAADQPFTIHFEMGFDEAADPGANRRATGGTIEADPSNHPRVQNT
jgi:hypothetical protein